MKTSHHKDATPPKISIVIPIYNEELSIPDLFSRLTATLTILPDSYEIIAVDDGSQDHSFTALTHIATHDTHVRVIRFKRNFGQTAALAAGIEHARGEIIVTLDADLENDPADIPRLIEKLDAEYSVVSGWRQDRWQGSFLTRKLPSLLANKLISLLTGVALHDYGCTLKAYRADVVKDIRLYGEMHRFIPAYAHWQGGKVIEIPVHYTPRVYGKSNYGIGRTSRVLLDLVVITFLHRFMNRPMHFFGTAGLASLVLGSFSGCVAIMLKILHLRDFVATPLPVLATLLIIVGIQLIMFGIIGEMLMRIYYESEDRRPYLIREIVGN